MKLYGVDVFTMEPFKGNTAVVCVLDGDKPDSWLQSMAAEMRVSETAFVDLSQASLPLRWFTPKLEVLLCGHATLATAHVLWRHLGEQRDLLRFTTLSGVLPVRRRDKRLALDLPAIEVSELAVDEQANAVLPDTWQAWYGNDHYAVGLLDSSEAVQSYRPDADTIMALGKPLILTAPGRDGDDFVSRFFAPGMGILEDPVTGSAHALLGRFWAWRLNKSTLTAYQASQRGGRLYIHCDGDTVTVGGYAVTVYQGKVC